jgi:hypothetical protein
MPSSPTVTLPKPPEGWTYSVAIDGPHGATVNVTAEPTGKRYRVTTTEVDGYTDFTDLREALAAAVSAAKTISGVAKAKALAEDGSRVLSGLLSKGSGRVDGGLEPVLDPPA